MACRSWREVPVTVRVDARNALLFLISTMMESFIAVPLDSDFPLSNLPWGVFTRLDQPDKPRIGVALGDSIVDVHQLDAAGCFTGPVLSQATCFQQVPAASSRTHTHIHSHARAPSSTNPLPRTASRAAHPQRLPGPGAERVARGAGHAHAPAERARGAAA